MYWETIAEFDTEADIPPYEEAENLAGQVDAETRTVAVEDEDRWYMERQSEDSGWAKVAKFTDDDDRAFHIVTESSFELPDGYRAVFLYDDEEYVIERYYDES